MWIAIAAALALCGACEGTDGVDVTAQDLCDSGQVPEGEEASGSLSATVGDDAFTACVAGGARDGADGDPLATLDVLGAHFVGNDEYGVLLRVTGPAVGEADIGAGQVPSGFVEWTAADGTAFVADQNRGEGTIEVTSFDETGAAGTFSVTVEQRESGDTLEITDGTFDVTF